MSDVLHLLELLNVAEEEEVHRHIPGVSGDGASQAEHLTGQEPVKEADGKAALVVAGNGAVDVLEGRVGVGEGDHGDVGVGSLLDGLGIDTGISDDQKSGLSELLGDLVGEGTGGESAGNALAASVLGELQHGTLAVRAGRDHDDILGVLDGGDDSGGEHQLLPGLAQVDDVDTIGSSLPDVLSHLEVRVGGTNVDLGGEELLDILLPNWCDHAKEISVSTRRKQITFSDIAKYLLGLQNDGQGRHDFCWGNTALALVICCDGHHFNHQVHYETGLPC